ncbi:MAG TPA: sensor histidine kinase, partial [Terriglobales bacterium]|nr:sensor histidine kinase [Terriglobales bacterium]
MIAVKQAGDWLRKNPFRLYLALIVLAVLPITLFVTAAHKLFLRQVTAQAVAASSQQGRVMGLIIEQHLNEQKAFVESLAMRPDVQRDWQAKNYAHLTATLAEVYRLHPELLGFGVCDPDGTLRAASPAPLPGAIGQRLTSRPWFGPVTSTWKPYISPVFRSPRPGNPLVIAVAVPLFSGGNPTGILISAETLDQVTSPVYSLVGPQSYRHLAFVDQQGQVFGKPDSSPVTLLNVDRDALAALQKDRPGTGRVMRMGGEQSIAAYSPIASLNWGVLIQAPVAAVGPAVWVYEKRLAILAAVIVVLALGAGALIAYLYRRLRESEQLYLQQIEGQNRELEIRNRAIEHASQLKTRFLATVSHELRTPLNAVLGFATLLSEEPSLGARQRRWTEHIRDGGRHLLQLVNDVLDLSKIEAGRLDLNREVFSAEAAVPEVTSTLSPLIQAKRIRLKIEIESGLLVYADRVRFKQVLYNLISNALKFTPAGGEVSVHGSRRGESACIEVEDTGVGISPEDQERIFEEFSQVGASDAA